MVPVRAAPSVASTSMCSFIGRVSGSAVEQHGVAEGQEPVALGQRRRGTGPASAGPANASTRASSDDRGTWKLVSSRSTTAKRVVAADEQAGAVLGLAGGRPRLQRPHHGGAHRDHLAGRRRPSARRAVSARDAVALGVHGVVLDPVGGDRAERAQARP